MKSTFEELQAFVSIVDSGSIVNAAHQLGQTTSGISRALHRLEQKLQVTLLERTTRKIKLTEEGQLFLEKARKILHDIDVAEEALIQSDDAISGVLRVDSASVFVLHVLVPLMQEFRLCYPCIEVELNSNERIIDLLEHRIDVAIRFGQLQDSSLHAKLLGHSRIYLVASPDYLARYGTPQTARDLLQHHLIGFSSIAALNTWPIQLDGQLFATKPSLKASNGETIRQLALAGNGIARLSKFLIHQDLQQGKLVAILESEIIPYFEHIHAVYYQQEHLPKRVRIFIEFIADKLKQYL